MKKLIVVLLFATLLCGCSSEPPYTDPEYDVTQIPYDALVYNDTKMPIKSIEIYQSQVNYEWLPYMIIRFDITDISDEQIHWLTTAESLTEGADLDIKLRYTSVQNEQASEAWPLVKKYYNRSEQELVYLYCDYNAGSRKDYSDISVKMNIDVRQEETYIGRNHSGSKKELHKFNKYKIRINGSLDDAVRVEVRPEAEMSDLDRQYFEKGFGEIAGYLGLT